MTLLLEPPTNTTTTGQPKILGLDLSMTATGVCLPDGSVYTIKTKPTDGDRRLNGIVNTIGSSLGDRVDSTGYDIDLVVMEEAPPGLKGPAIKAIHMVHGAVRMWLNDFDIPYVTINPTTLKMYAVGKSGADKIAMAMAAYKRAGVEFADDNQCDAWWLRTAGLDQLGHAPFALPQSQRAALDKAIWPETAATR